MHHGLSPVATTCSVISMWSQKYELLSNMLTFCGFGNSVLYLKLMQSILMRLSLDRLCAKNTQDVVQQIKRTKINHKGAAVVAIDKKAKMCNSC